MTELPFPTARRVDPSPDGPCGGRDGETGVISGDGAPGAESPAPEAESVQPRGAAKTVLANARLVLPDAILTGMITMAGGQIVDITPGSHVPHGAIDCDGDLVMPGLVELHTDNLERHIQPRPKVDWPHADAIIAHDAEMASVGITTVFDALRVGSVLSGSARYPEYARGLATEILQLRAQGALRVSHYLHLRAEIVSETLADEFEKFGPADRVGIVSLMDHTPGARQFRDLTKLRDYVLGKGGDADSFARQMDELRALKARHGDHHEALTVAAARRLGAVLASHDDTTAAHVAQSAAYGAGFAEFPTTEEAARACKHHGIPVMMGAPNLIRGGSHSGNVAAETLARDGMLDIVSSDYVPSALLSSALLLGRLWNDLPRGVATVTAAPAAAAGLFDRGALVPGKRADVIRVVQLGAAGAVRGVWVAGARVG